MTWLESPLLLVHIIGLTLGAGCTTAKFALLFKSKADPAFLPPYFLVAKAITRLIVLGLVLRLLSGIGLLAMGHALGARLVLNSS